MNVLKVGEVVERVEKETKWLKLLLHNNRGMEDKMRYGERKR